MTALVQTCSADLPETSGGDWGTVVGKAVGLAWHYRRAFLQLGAVLTLPLLVIAIALAFLLPATADDSAASLGPDLPTDGDPILAFALLIGLGAALVCIVAVAQLAGDCAFLIRAEPP